MNNREKVIKAIECCVVNHTRCFDDNDKLCPYFSTKVYMCEIELLRDALALLKEEGKTINYLTDTIRQLNQHIKDLSEYMTPYGKVKDVKAYAESLKEQEAVVPGIAQDVDGIFATCGNCKIKLWKIIGLENVVNLDEMPRFCPHCGRPVKLNERIHRASHSARND